MITPNIERLYAEIRKQILLVQSYTEIKELAFIIKACRLKPHSFIFGKKDKRLILHKWWVDEFGNSLKVIKNKKIKIIGNDLSIPSNKIVCTDLYYGLPLDKIAKMSKLLYLCHGKDEDLQEYFFITFLGIDNYFRSYLNIDGEWQQVSTLLLGLKNLRALVRHVDIKYFLEFSNKEKAPLPCARAREWITFMPASREFLLVLKKHYDNAFSFLDIQ
jgi:hypothetical protein